MTGDGLSIPGIPLELRSLHSKYLVNMSQETEESRLRVGDYRVRFVEEADAILIKRVLHRSDAYR